MKFLPRMHGGGARGASPVLMSRVAGQRSHALKPASRSIKAISVPILIWITRAKKEVERFPPALVPASGPTLFIPWPGRKI